MINVKDFTNDLHDALDALKRYEIPEAIARLRAMQSQHHGEHATLESVLNLDDRYTQLTKRFAKDKDANQVAEDYHTLARELYEEIGSESWYMRIRTECDTYGKESIQEQKGYKAADESQREEALDRLFHLIWKEKPYCNGGGMGIAEYPVSVQEYLISAVTLSLLEYFHTDRLKSLIQLAHSQDTGLRMRAMVGILCCCCIHKNIMPFYPEAIKLITDLFSHKQYCKYATYFQANMILVAASGDACRELKEEIIPQLTKLLDANKDKFGFNDNNAGDLEDFLSNSANLSPEEKKLKKEIDKKMRRLFDIFSTGIDINQGAMQELYKHPFFDTTSHWLLPFTPERSEIKGLSGIDSEELIGFHLSITGNTSLCDTDKYALSLKVQSEMGKRMVKRAEELEESIPEETLENFVIQMKRMKPSEDDSMRNYIQSLYRFFKRSSFTSINDIDPFTDDAQLLISVPFLRDTLTHTEAYLCTLAEMCGSLGRFEDAIYYWQTDIDHFGATAATYEHLAHNQEMMGMTDEAITSYRKSLQLEPDNKETADRLQRAYGKAGLYDKQLKVLLQLEQAMPDDAAILTATGLCLINLEQWKEAAQRFHKMELNGQRELPSYRAIAWCAMMQSDFKKAAKYYAYLIASPSAKWEDYLNMGHIHLLLYQNSKALKHYTEALTRYSHKLKHGEECIEAFDADIPLLQRKGLNMADIMLMRGCIKQRMDL